VLLFVKYSIVFAASFLCASLGAAAGHSFATVTLPTKEKIDYLVATPDPATLSGVLLVLPPGKQDRSMVELGVKNWIADFVREGFAVVSPVAPGGKHFHKGSAKLLKPFYAAVQKAKAWEAYPTHVIGLSNGGIAAFTLASEQPEVFGNLVVAPGFNRPGDKLDRLAGKKVTLFVGSKDQEWMGRAHASIQLLKTNGVRGEIKIIPGAGHRVFTSVSAAQILAALR
jgi:pimeloyl-ACP methyl ester carboxylesterase